MTADQLPSEVHQFLRAHIQTVLHLELLLLLHAHPNEWWTAETANSKVRASVDGSGQYLRALCDTKLVESSGGAAPKYRFAPKREQDAATVATIAGLFRTHYYALVEAIYAARRRDIQDFANAFKLTKKSDTDG